LGRNKLGTLRAIKIVHRAAFEDARPFEREFKGIQKFEPISRSHEGLVDILQVGGTEDYFYYVMELADPVIGNQCSVVNNESREMVEDSSSARPLNNDLLIAGYSSRTLRSDLKRRGRLPVAECVRIGLSLASALGHLHQQRLVHRDIKPSNVIFVGGAPKLADIGLVADLGEARSFVGTQGFIAPEGPGAPQADLYSLGKVLYELSTGKDRHDFPELPENLRDLPDQEALIEFNAVLVKACATDPRQRYQTAEELQAELALLQRGVSVKRRRAAQRRWSAAKRICLAAAAVMFLMGSASLLNMFGSRDRPNTEAVRLYNLGRDYSSQLTDEDLKKSIEYLNQAIHVDPAFVPAYVALFEVSTFSLVGGSWQQRFEMQQECARKLMKLAPQLGESHAALSWAKSSTNDWAGAEAEIRHAIELSPNYPFAHVAYGCYLTWLGRADEARDKFHRAQQLDPMSPIVATCSGFPFYAKRQFPEAIAQFGKALELRPNCGWTRMWIGKAHEANGDYLRAIAQFEALDLQAAPDAVKVKERYASLRRALAASGAVGYWQKVLELFQEKQTTSLLEYDRYDLPGIYARLGDKERALEELEKDDRANELSSWLLFDASYDSLREEPRFKALLRAASLAK